MDRDLYSFFGQTPKSIFLLFQLMLIFIKSSPDICEEIWVWVAGAIAYIAMGFPLRTLKICFF